MYRDREGRKMEKSEEGGEEEAETEKGEKGVCVRACLRAGVRAPLRRVRLRAPALRAVKD
jgi:hypothetical protein